MAEISSTRISELTAAEKLSDDHLFVIASLKDGTSYETNYKVSASGIYDYVKDKLAISAAHLDGDCIPIAKIGGTEISAPKSGGSGASGNFSIVDAIYPVGSLYITALSGDCTFNKLSSTIGGETYYMHWLQIARNLCLQGSDTTLQAGNTIAAGLPDIQGQFNGICAPTLYNGCFCTTTTTKGADHGVSNAGIDFKASRYNSIYGNSDTVQPPAYKVAIFRRYDNITEAQKKAIDDSGWPTKDDIFNIDSSNCTISYENALSNNVEMTSMTTPLGFKSVVVDSDGNLNLAGTSESDIFNDPDKFNTDLFNDGTVGVGGGILSSITFDKGVRPLFRKIRISPGVVTYVDNYLTSNYTGISGYKWHLNSKNNDYVIPPTTASNAILKNSKRYCIYSRSCNLSVTMQLSSDNNTTLSKTISASKTTSGTSTTISDWNNATTAAKSTPYTALNKKYYQFSFSSFIIDALNEDPTYRICKLTFNAGSYSMPVNQVVCYNFI